MMQSFWIRTVLGLGALALPSLSLTPAPPAPPIQDEHQNARIVTAANQFLSTLDAKQRQSVVFAFDDAAQRARWSNFPISMVPRGGISLKDMNSAQRSAAMALVASALSPRGFEKVQQIMEGDEVNKTTDQGPPGARGPGPPPGNKGPPPFARGGGAGGPALGNGPMFGKDLYYVSILGTPSEKTPWMLQFGGHHLALNITMA